MKKFIVLLCAVFAVVLVAVLGCSKTAPAGPLGVNKIEPTLTPSATPNQLFKVQVLEGGTPVPSIEVKIAPQGVTVQSSTQTDAEGTASFTVHSGGKWDVVIPGQNSYEVLNYVVEPLTNTFFAVELGTQSIDLTLESGNPNLPISPSTVTYRLTYHCDKSKQYKAEIVGVPAGIAIKPYDDVVRYNGDVRFITLDIPKSYEGVSALGTQLYVSATAIQGTKKIQSGNQMIRRNWAFNVSANVKFAKTYLGPDLLNGCSSDCGRTVYWIGATNFSLDAQNFATVGILKREYVRYSLSGEVAEIHGVTHKSGEIELGEGYYDELIEAVTNAGYDWVKDHNDANGTITLRFYDDGYLDVKRTFYTSASFGDMCGYFVQQCFWMYKSYFTQCGGYPNNTGCSYCPMQLKKKRSGNCYSVSE